MEYPCTGYYIGHAVGIDYIAVKEVEILSEFVRTSRSGLCYSMRDTGKFLFRGPKYKPTSERLTHPAGPEITSASAHHIALSLEQAQENFNRELDRLRRETYNSLQYVNLNINALLGQLLRGQALELASGRRPDTFG